MCELVLECASPWPSRSMVRSLCERFAGPLWTIFPLLLSPCFALATPLHFKELKAASVGQLPSTVTLEEVWKTLEAMHEGPSDLLGLLHSLGYVRGLLSSLGYPEERRVQVLVRIA